MTISWSARGSGDDEGDGASIRGSSAVVSTAEFNPSNSSSASEDGKSGGIEGGGACIGCNSGVLLLGATTTLFQWYLGGGTAWLPSDQFPRAAHQISLSIMVSNTEDLCLGTLRFLAMPNYEEDYKESIECNGLTVCMVT